MVDRVPILTRKPIIFTNLFSLTDYDITQELSVLRDEYDYQTMVVDSSNVDESYWENLGQKAQLINSSGVKVRVVATDYVAKNFLSYLMTSPFNIVQFNVNMVDGFHEKMLRSSISQSGVCGLYTCVVFYPIIPTVLKTHELIELVLSMPDCDAIGIKFLETEDYSVDVNTVTVGEYSFNKKYATINDGVLSCKDEYVDEFYRIVKSFLGHRKVDCFVYGDE